MFGKAFVTLALAAVALAQELRVNSPASLIQCQPALLTWTGGQSPYFVAAIPGGQPSAAALKDFGQQTGTQLTWNVDLPAGTSVTIKITDASGAVNYNSAVTIQEGSSSSCLNGGGASGSASAAATSAASAASAASSGVASASMAASSAAASVASSAGGAVSSASRAVASGASSAAGAASSAASAARSGGASAASAAASAATSSGAASPFAVADVKTGAFAILLGAAGLTLF